MIFVYNLKFLFIAHVTLLLGCGAGSQSGYITKQDEYHWNQATENGILVNEGYERCRRFVDAWLAKADPATGLIPRNLTDGKDIWNAKDAAADNYPFMVLTTALTDSLLFGTTMMHMLNQEIKLTSRVDNLPDTYNFVKQGFDNDQVVMSDIIFGSSEYIKDGLLPLTEWLGESPWSDRMLDILDDIWAHATIETTFGNIPSDNVEVNGEMLQVLSRIFYMTGDDKYREWAIRLGDYYLLGDHHPTRDFASLRLRDHGCEIVSGLCEIYAVLHFSDPAKKEVYRPYIHEMLDRILEVGRNDDGLFYDIVNPQSGEIIRDRIADNFGYNLNGFYTVYQLDSIVSYREAVIKALNALADNYRNFDWENGSADGYADAIEGALNLFNREGLNRLSSWLDSEIKVMWDMQQPDGIIEGWHGDGNFARTTIMYNLWKTKGITASPWRSDLQIGAEISGDTIWFALSTEKPWSGKINFDQARHTKNLNLPYDWPRINQFPEWFVAEGLKEYKVEQKEVESKRQIFRGGLSSGLFLQVGEGRHYFKVIPIRE